MRVFTVFGAVLAGVAAQRSGDTSYHDGASINKFSIGLADTGVLRAEPETIYSGDIATVYASVAPTAVRFDALAAGPTASLARSPTRIPAAGFSLSLDSSSSASAHPCITLLGALALVRAGRSLQLRMRALCACCFMSPRLRRCVLVTSCRHSKHHDEADSSARGAFEHSRPRKSTVLHAHCTHRESCCALAAAAIARTRARFSAFSVARVISEPCTSPLLA